MGIQWRDIVQHIWRGESHSERKFWIVWRGKAAQAGGTDTDDRSSHAASIAHVVPPLFPGISAPLNTDSQTEQSHLNRSNQDRYSLQMGGWKDCGVFPIIAQNFLQNLFCLSKNQAHVATSIRFEHPRGHRAGACLICRAVSLPEHPRHWGFSHADGMEKCGLKQILSWRICSDVMLLFSTWSNQPGYSLPVEMVCSTDNLN